MFHPLFFPNAVPVVHEAFKSARIALFTPIFLDILHTIVRYALHNSAELIIGAIIYFIHLTTLQVHVLYSLCSSQTINAVIPYINSCTSLLEDLCLLWHKAVMKADVLYHQALGFVLVQFMYFCNYENLYAVSNNLDPNDIQLNVNRHIDSRVYDLLHNLHLSINVLQNKDESANAQSTVSKSKSVAAQKAMEEARIRAQQQMQAFADEMSDDSDDEMEDVTADGMMTSRKKKEEHVCIICKEKSGGPLGFLCLAQPSNNIQHTILTDTNPIYDQSLYRVVSDKGCDVHVLNNPTSRILTHLPYNEHVTVLKCVGQWTEITKPVRGFVMLYANKSGNEGTTVNEPNVALSGFCDEVVTILHPVSKMWFHKHGETRIQGKLHSNRISYVSVVTAA
jgi:hypothetical protein